jgi:integrase
MASDGVIFKRCGCRDPRTRKRLEQSCPRLAERRHGSWSFHCSVATMFGQRERVRRGGYATRRDAEAARDELLERSRAERTTQTWTVARWLRHWLSTRSSIRPSTLRSYTDHVERHLIPYLGRIRLGELTGRDVAAMFAALAGTQTRLGRPPTPSTLHRIRATLRSALNAAIRDGLLRDNPARLAELPTPCRPQAQVWTDPRVDAWRRTGQRFAVAVWTAKQLVAFLDFVADDRLFAMWWLIALRGMRRGEAAGLRWVDVDLDQKIIMIDQQRLAYGRTVAVGRPRPQPAAAPSPWTAPPCGCCAPTCNASARSGSPPATGGTTPGTYSPPSTGRRCTRTG